MILLDTNVLSQPIREDGARVVIDWLDAHDAEVAIPAISIAELVYGYECLPAGRRHVALTDAVFSLLKLYEDRVVPFDRAAAEAHGWLTAKLEREGRPTPVMDTQIAAIALARDATVATRNVGHFAPAGVRVVNPWEA